MTAFLLLTALFTGLHNNDYGLSAVKRYWVQAQVIEEDEWFFGGPWRFVEDAAAVQDRFNRITPDTPPAVAKHTLPPTDYITEAIWWQGRFERYLQQRKPYLNWAELQELEQINEDLAQRRRVWELMRTIRQSYTTGEGRRLQLELLRNLVGRVNFEAGEWPNPQPPAAANSVWGWIEDTEEQP
jgi:hypothetical protein